MAPLVGRACATGCAPLMGSGGGLVAVGLARAEVTVHGDPLLSTAPPWLGDEVSYVSVFALRTAGTSGSEASAFTRSLSDRLVDPAGPLEEGYVCTEPVDGRGGEFLLGDCRGIDRALDLDSAL